jgi:hypothetical protein
LRVSRSRAASTEHPPARGGRLLDQLHVVAPHVGRVLAGEEAEGDRPAGLHGQGLQAAVVVGQVGMIDLAVHALAGQLEDARVQLAHHPDQAPHLVPRGHAARHRPGIRGLVTG